MRPSGLHYFNFCKYHVFSISTSSFVIFFHLSFQKLIIQLIYVHPLGRTLLRDKQPLRSSWAGTQQAPPTKCVRQTPIMCRPTASGHLGKFLCTAHFYFQLCNMLHSSVKLTQPTEIGTSMTMHTASYHAQKRNATTSAIPVSYAVQHHKVLHKYTQVHCNAKEFYRGRTHSQKEHSDTK